MVTSADLGGPNVSSSHQPFDANALTDYADTSMKSCIQVAIDLSSDANELSACYEKEVGSPQRLNFVSTNMDNRVQQPEQSGGHHTCVGGVDGQGVTRILDGGSVGSSDGDAWSCSSTSDVVDSKKTSAPCMVSTQPPRLPRSLTRHVVTRW